MGDHDAKLAGSVELDDAFFGTPTEGANAKAFVGGTFHGLAPKHLQSYLDEFCFRTNRRNFEGQLFNRLLIACVSFDTITYRDLTA